MCFLGDDMLMIPGYFRYVVLTYVYVHKCLEQECRIVNQSDDMLNIPRYYRYVVRTYKCIKVSNNRIINQSGSCTLRPATPPYLLFPVASTTNLIGYNIFTSFVDRH